MSDFMKESLELAAEISSIRRHIHQNAELGDDLPITTAYVMDQLKGMGLEPKEICKSGVVAVIEGEHPGKTIMLRADMDALPMQELNDLPFKSTTACAHTCGHDLHTAMLLGAAKLLIRHRSELHGRVKLMFQPAEEIFTGSAAMLKNGLMENPSVDAAMGMHVMTELPLGVIAYNNGFVSSSCDGFKINIKGKGCHGAQPQNGIDPINVGVHIHLALQALISRETPPDQTAVLTVCQFTAGTTANIIPESAVLQGTMRTFDKDLRAKLYTRFKEVIEYTAKTFGATAELEVLSDVPSIYNNLEMLEECLGYLSELDADFTMRPNYRFTASDDYARVSDLVPSIYLSIGAAPTDPSKIFPNHNPKVEFNEDCLAQGAAIFAQCSLEWLKTHK